MDFPSRLSPHRAAILISSHDWPRNYYPGYIHFCQIDDTLLLRIGLTQLRFELRMSFHSSFAVVVVRS